jgi:hypothetical protein
MNDEQSLTQDYEVDAPVTTGWRPISTAPREVVRWRPVDLWMTVHASPMSFGMSDSFRVTDCWRDDAGKWVHDFRGEVAELNAWYITHWMLPPASPNAQAEGSQP